MDYVKSSSQSPVPNPQSPIPNPQSPKTGSVTLQGTEYAFNRREREIPLNRRHWGMRAFSMLWGILMLDVLLNDFQWRTTTGNNKFLPPP